MRKHVKAFIMNGLIACGLGPVALSVIYAILGAAGVVSTVSVGEMVTGVVSVTVLAFIAGGISIIYKIEKLPIAIAALTHAGVLYLDYIVIYLINGWLKGGVIPFIVFTSCFFAGFALVWAIIYLTTKKSTEEVNMVLSSIQYSYEE